MNVICSIVCHWAYAGREKPGRTVRKETPKPDDTFDCFFETPGLDWCLGHTSRRGRLQVIVDAKATDHYVGLDRKGGEPHRRSSNGGVGCYDKALVRGKCQASSGLKLKLHCLSQSGDFGTAFLDGRGRRGRGQVIDVKGKSGRGVGLLNGL
jgi:hypothetical protein